MSAPSLLTTHVELRPNRDGEPRAYVVGSRVRVQDIVSDHERHGLSPEQIVREHPHLTLAQVHGALAFYFDHREEILQQMKADENFVRSLEEKRQ